MFIQDLFVSYFDYRPFKSQLLNKLCGNSSKLIGVIGQRLLPIWFALFPGKIKPDGYRVPITVSLTSFPERIGKIWIVIESIIRQTIQPQNVILYLSEQQFSQIKIPQNLSRYVKSGFLQIVWVKEDYRSYKKFWYFIKDHPSEPFITIDDDIIYHSNTLSKLIKKKDKHPGMVIACYCYKISFDKNGIPKPYLLWERQTHEGDVGEDVFFGSGGGTYFPVGCLKGADVEYQTIESICPFADDIWLNGFVRINKYKVLCASDRRSVLCVYNKINKSLSAHNMSERGNDIQISKFSKWAKEFYNIDPFCKK